MSLVWKDQDGYININTGTDTYDFKAEQCDNEYKLAGWISHLSEKKWWSKAHEKQLREVALPNAA